ncbi:RHS repeat-associated core domain-containing protein [Pseudomonas monteilii]|uniref:RHS repeat-associated core domain-containing protein n=1 Tax=Pseudomonas monteilii TaxID=76759 RepID=UPI0036EADC00
MSSKGEDKPELHCYAAYGHTSSLPSQRTVSGFNGESLTSFLASYLLGNGYRAFSPVLMRFHSADSLSPFDAGGLNAYAYCLGDPINNADPDGHSSWSWLRTRKFTPFSRTPQQKVNQRAASLAAITQKLKEQTAELTLADSQRAKFGKLARKNANHYATTADALYNKGIRKLTGISKYTSEATIPDTVNRSVNILNNAAEALNFHEGKNTRINSYLAETKPPAKDPVFGRRKRQDHTENDRSLSDEQSGLRQGK